MILQTNFDGDINVGMYGVCNNEVCIIGEILNKKYVEQIENALQVKVVKATISNSYLIGLFSFMNSNGIILPKTIEDYELKKLKNYLKEFDLNFLILKSKYTAIGNLIVGNNKGAVISPLFSKKEKKMIENVLGVEVVFGKIAKLNIPGSCAVANDFGVYAHYGIYGSELKKIESTLKVDVVAGTINSGSPYVKSGIIANDKGAVIGSLSTGPEINNILEAFQV